jgi:hypothetical protein
MRTHRRAGLAFLGLLALAPLGPAQDTKGDKTAPEDQQVVSSKATKRTPASSVNFRKELGLPYSSLGTLGSRAEAARRASDPVALAHTASELAVAESVSGKTATVTSKQLMKEAAELAAMRKQTDELRALLKVSEQVQTEADTVASLRDQLALTRKQAQADKEAFERNQEPTFAPRQVVLNNYTPQYVDLWVNGTYKVQVAPGMSQTVPIQHRWNPTVLTAYGDDDTQTWGPRYVWGRFTKYTWNIE